MWSDGVIKPVTRGDGDIRSQFRPSATSCTAPIADPAALTGHSLRKEDWKHKIVTTISSPLDYRSSGTLTPSFFSGKESNPIG